MSDGPRGRNWCFTAFYPDGGDDLGRCPEPWAEGYLQSLFSGCGGFVVGQLEICPDTHRHHVQGFVQLPTRLRFSQLQRLCRTGIHLEIAKAPKQAIEYCQKLDTRVSGPWSLGVAPVFQGRRSDLHRLYSQLVDNERDPYDLLLDPEFGPTTMRHYKAVRQVRWAVAKRGRRKLMMERIEAGGSPLIPPKCLWMIGPTGIRKTSSILKTHGVQVYTPATTKDGDSLWFDNYDDEEVLLLDEFHPKQMPVSTFLRLTGGDPTLQLPVKGASTYVCFKYVYIVQNTYTPYDVHPSIADAILRRVRERVVVDTEDVESCISYFASDNV